MSKREAMRVEQDETTIMSDANTATEPAAIDARIVEEDPASVERERLDLVHARRELEAAKARIQRDAQRALDEMKSTLVRELLSVLDNIDRACAAAEENGDAPAVVIGVRLVRRQLENVLHGYGLERFDSVGATFDPAIHDAVQMVAREGQEGDELVVVEQLQPGYRFGPRLLRAEKVIVGRSRPPGSA